MTCCGSSLLPAAVNFPATARCCPDKKSIETYSRKKFCFCQSNFPLRKHWFYFLRESAKAGSLQKKIYQIKSQYHQKTKILWHDKDFGFFVPSFRYPKTKKADTAFAISALLSCFRMNLRSGKTYFRFAFRTSAILVIPSLILSSGMQE